MPSENEWYTGGCCKGGCAECSGGCAECSGGRWTGGEIAGGIEDDFGVAGDLYEGVEGGCDACGCGCKNKNCGPKCPNCNCFKKSKKSVVKKRSVKKKSNKKRSVKKRSVKKNGKK